MHIQQQRQHDILVIAPTGRIDSTTSDALQAAVSAALDAGEKRLVIDFSGVEYISSAGLRVMLVTAKRLGAAGGALVLCALGEAVRQVFDLAGFLPLFTIESSNSAAVSRIAGAA